MTGRGIALAAFLSALAFAACTSDSATGPHPNVTGTWTLQGVFFATGDSLGNSVTDTLELTSMLMTLRQSGTAFTGTYSGAVISVFSNRPFFGPTNSGLLSGSIGSGTATGATVVFSPTLSNQPFQGVLTDSAMQGDGTIYYTGSSGGTEKFTGGWTAVRN
jgi:hypothetical protein